jgi:hypothetical protein
LIVLRSERRYWLASLTCNASLQGGVTSQAVIKRALRYSALKFKFDQGIIRPGFIGKRRKIHADIAIHGDKTRNGILRTLRHFSLHIWWHLASCSRILGHVSIATNIPQQSVPIELPPQNSHGSSITPWENDDPLIGYFKRDKHATSRTSD